MSKNLKFSVWNWKLAKLVLMSIQANDLKIASSWIELNQIVWLRPAIDTEGVLGVLRTPKWSFRHPQGVQISQGVQMGVQIIQLYARLTYWYA